MDVYADRHKPGGDNPVAPSFGIDKPQITRQVGIDFALSNPSRLHSLTLACSVFGWLTLRSAPVEAMTLTCLLST